MSNSPEEDPRLDPRIRVIASNWPQDPPSDVTSREELLVDASSLEGRRRLADEVAFLEGADSEEVAPSSGLRIERREISAPGGHYLNLAIFRPQSTQALPCVYFIHGGAMAALSCFYANYRAWGKILAAKGVVVVMIDFRNAVVPSSVLEVAPFPAGLEDCLTGLDWVREHSEELGVDRSRVVVAGESGGGNLTLATGLSLLRAGRIDVVAGLYALCPYINGSWPDERYRSSREFNRYALELHTNRGAMGYGIEAFEAGNPLAWPNFATVDELRGLPPTVISVNECDPLRDEGIDFFRRLLAADVRARGRIVLATTHAAEFYPTMCPEITHSTARDLADFASRSA